MKKILKVIGSVILVIGVAALGLFGYEKLYQMNRKNQAKKVFSKYLETNYTELDIVGGDLRYNPKDDYVYLDLDVRDSEDMDFSLSTDSEGKVMSDYDFVVSNHGNITNRLQIYLNQISWKEPIKHLFKDNYKFDFVTMNEEKWLQNPPEQDTSIEDLLKAYPIECMVYVKDVSLYSDEELEKLKIQVQEEYRQYGLEFSKVTIN